MLSDFSEMNCYKDNKDVMKRTRPDVYRIEAVVVLDNTITYISTAVQGD